MRFRACRTIPSHRRFVDHRRDSLAERLVQPRTKVEGEVPGQTTVQPGDLNDALKGSNVGPIV
jgi:hypothetical protein